MHRPALGYAKDSIEFHQKLRENSADIGMICLFVAQIMLLAMHEAMKWHEDGSFVIGFGFGFCGDQCGHRVTSE
jgi:hypothetical protein